MKFMLDKKESYTVVTVLEDKLNTLNAADFKTELKVLNEGGVRNIILDLSNVTFADSSGLGAILVGNRLCEASGGTFVLSGLSIGVKRIVDISQLGSVLTIIPTVQEAIDFVMMEELVRELSGDAEEEDDLTSDDSSGNE
ncbi:anti-sigma factor antagonist [Sphingobacteriales bacterium UPWRP_1]|nr:hypothetical protein BVG80_04500 [Sphingobacteriales bacterium TSM_CSM]PSJ76080.1 anti-sigma factor antagonist [Sphingobacteriales bacterium UPWRP_1]